MNIKFLYLLTVISAVLPAFNANAYTVNVTVKLVRPLPCVINGTKDIDVSFKDALNTDLINGSNYIQSIGYDLNCPDAQPGSFMRLMMKGDDFGDGALKTNVEGLGIALKMDKNALAVNKWVTFNYQNKPVLQAVPVKKDNITLSGSDFKATASLLVDYQ